MSETDPDKKSYEIANLRQLLDHPDFNAALYAGNDVVTCPSDLERLNPILTANQILGTIAKIATGAAVEPRNYIFATGTAAHVVQNRVISNALQIFEPEFQSRTVEVRKWGHATIVREELTLDSNALQNPVVRKHLPDASAIADADAPEIYGTMYHISSDLMRD